MSKKGGVMAKMALVLGLLLCAFVVANTALADDSGVEKMSWALQDEVLRWENLGPGGAHQAVKLCMYTAMQVSPKQIKAIKETGAKVLGSMFNQVIVETANPAVVRALAQLSFVGYMDFVIPFTSGPVPMLPNASLQTPSEEEKISIQKQLQPNEALIVYSVKANSLVIQVIDYKHVYIPQSVVIARQNIINKIINLYSALQIPTGEKDVQEVLEDLYDLLIRPIQSELADKDALIIVPNGPLWYVPFSALLAKDKTSVLQPCLVPSPPYLVEDYTISYLPSLESAMAFLESEPAHTRGEFLGIFSERAHLYGKEIGRSLERCSRCLAEQTSSILITAAEELTETDFKEQAQSASFIALFAPTTFNPSDPGGSYISFAGSKKDDGTLHVKEVAGLKLRDVDLVVLGMAGPLPKALRPGYVSGAGKQFAFTGPRAVLVWPQAFLNAGADAVIQPLWPVNVVALEKLMVSMCVYHNQGDTWAQALAKAQRDLIKDTTFNNPWLWAPYQLIGRWR